MKTLLLSLAMGILLGWMLKKTRRVHVAAKINKATLPALYVFLAAVGITVGGNQEIARNLYNVVAKAGILAVGSILGSVLLVSLVKRFMRVDGGNGSQNDADSNNGKPAKVLRVDSSVLQTCGASLLVFGSFAFGVVLGMQSLVAFNTVAVRAVIIAMFSFLTFSVGLNSGSDDLLMNVLRRARPTVLLLPLIVVCGTFLGTFLLSPLLPGISATQAMGVGAGLGYYSLSSLMISNLANPMLGAVALLANLFREVLTIGLGPLLVKVFGPVGLIASGASSSCSVVLPTVTDFAGKDFVPMALMSGLILEVAAPLLISLVFMTF